MATKQEEKPESNDLFEPYKQEITRLQRQIKGYKGQLKKFEALEAGSRTKQVDSGRAEQDSSDSKPAQVGEIHAAHPWERKCTTCGGDNENFKAPPNVFCHGPKCNGRVPVGYVEVDEVLKLGKNEKGQYDISGMVKPCTNCGTHDHEVIEPGVVT